MLQAEGTAKTKALGLELAFMGTAGERPEWLKGVGKEQSSQISDTATYAVILLTQPPPPSPPHNTHMHKGKKKIKSESDQASRVKYQLTVNMREENINPHHRVIDK